MNVRDCRCFSEVAHYLSLLDASHVEYTLQALFKSQSNSWFLGKYNYSRAERDISVYMQPLR